MDSNFYAPDIERAVIGAMLINDEAIGKAIELINPEVFYSPFNRIIFKTLIDMYENNTPVDCLSVIECLKNLGHLEAIGGETTIASLMAEATTSANIEYHCGIIKKKAQLNQLNILSSQINNLCSDTEAEPNAICDKIECMIDKIISGDEIKEIKAVKDLIHPFTDELEKKYLAGGGLIGLPSGFFNLDKITGGLIKSNLIIVGGKTSHGKTSFALNIANNVSKRGHSVGIFSLEMSSNEVMKTLLQIEARYDMNRIFNGEKLEKSDWEIISDGACRLYNSNIYIIDRGGITISELNAITKRMKRDYKLELLIIDYLQLMIGHGDTREQEVASISRGLKALAKNLDIPVIALSQFSREVDRRKGEPKLSDLRESGALEQDANIVLFLYDGNADEKDYGYGDNNKNIRELIIAKHRSGKTGTELLSWKAWNTTFNDLETTNFNKGFYNEKQQKRT